MSFPKSTDLVTLTRPRRGNPRPRRLTNREKEYDIVDTLPSDRQDDRAGSSFTQVIRRGEEIGRIEGVGGVFLDFGRDGAVRLELGLGGAHGAGSEGGERRRRKGKDGIVRKDKSGGRGVGWRWKWASEEVDDLKLKVGESKIIFPATRDAAVPLPDIALPALLNSAANYVTDLFGMDQHSILPQLVSEEIAMNYHASAKLVEIYKGNTLCTISFPLARFAKWVLLFPTGEIGNHLNVSAFLPRTLSKKHAKSTSRFMPSAKAVYRFPTEIMQITSSPAEAEYREHFGCQILVVRLQFSIHIFSLAANPVYTPSKSISPVILTPLGVLGTSDLSNRKPVDVSVDPIDWGRVLAVDECGGLWLWEQERYLDNNRSSISTMKVRLVREASTAEKDRFHRIAFGTQSDTAILISRKKAVILNLNDPQGETVLFTLTARGQYFTSLEKTAALRPASFTCLCTSQEVIWMDETRPGDSVLSWRHDYGGGRVDDLEVAVVETGHGESTILSSRSNPLIMVFNTSTNSPIQSRHAPYSLSLPIPSNSKPLSSFTTVMLSVDSQSPRAPTLLLGQSADLSIWSTELLSLAESEPDVRRSRSGHRIRDLPSLKVIWDDDVKDLGYGKQTSEGSRNQWTWRDKAKTKSRAVNFRWAWLAINNSSEEIEDDHSFSAEGFKTHLREIDSPFEHIMTAAELARDAIYVDSDLRSHLLNTLPLSTGDHREEFKAVAEFDMSKHLSVIGNLQPSHRHSESSDISAVLREIQADFPRPMNLPKHLRNIRNLHQQALALDLALSFVIIAPDESFSTKVHVSPARLRPGSTPEDMFDQAAELSLKDNQPPLIKFSLLSPRSDHAAHPAEASENKIEIQGLTARHLLAEWDISSNPTDYLWKPLFEVKGAQQITTPTRQIRPLPSPRPGHYIQSQPSSLPTVPVLRQSQSQALPYTQNSRASIPSFAAHNIAGMRQPQSTRLAMPLPSLLRRPQTPPRQHTRSSPPPVLSHSLVSGIDLPNTQVERGVYGGRLDSGQIGKGLRKKSVKKRAGGF